MELGDGLKALAQAGQAGEVREWLMRLGDEVGVQYDQIRGNGTRTEDYKRYQLAAAYVRVREAVQAEVERRAAGMRVVDQGDAERVLGVAGLPGDAASLAISRRDASDRVAGVGSADDLRALLQRATRMGDEVLARAVAERALEDLDSKTMNLFLEDRPELDESVNRLWKAKQSESSGFAVMVELAGLRPSELSSMPMSAIEKLAADEPEEPVEPTPFTPAPAGGFMMTKGYGFGSQT